MRVSSTRQSAVARILEFSAESSGCREMARRQIVSVSTSRRIEGIGILRRVQTHERIARRFITPNKLAGVLAMTLAGMLTFNVMIPVVALRRSTDWLFWLLVGSIVLFYPLVRIKAGWAQMLFRASLWATLLAAIQIVVSLIFGARFAILSDSGSAPMPAWASGCLGTAFLVTMAIIGFITCVICVIATLIAVRSR
jgi:hypothetical protein